MKKEIISDRAVKLFEEGFHCSQAVLYVCAEFLEIKDPSQAVAAVSPFGGGLASTGNVCGCLPGALAALGIAMGKKTPEAKDGRDMWRLGYKMVKEFEKITGEYGGGNCRDIAAVNWKDRKDVMAFRKNEDGRRKMCHRVLRKTVETMYDLLEEYKSKKE